MDAASPGKQSKFYNLATKNAIKMKLTAIVHVHKTFQLALNWGVTHRVWEGVIEKLPKISQRISFLT